MLKKFMKHYLYIGLTLTAGFFGYELIKDIESTPTYNDI